MRTFRSRWLVALVAVFALVMTACSSDDGDTSGDTGAEPAGETVCSTTDTSAGDALASICDAGVIKVSTDPEYPPQSSLNPETGEYEGFDISTATEIADRLGVEVEWVTPAWEAIIAGNWNGRWDMSVGSMTPTEERAEVLDFTPPYYFVPASVAVGADSEITSPEELSGQTVAVCAGCTYDFFLNGDPLGIAGYEPPPNPITDAEVRGFNTDSPAVQAVIAGQADGVVSSFTLLQDKIDNGAAIKLVGDPLFYEPLAIAFDKSADLDQASLVAAVAGIVEEMHTDGTLTEFSNTWFGEDFTVESAA